MEDVFNENKNECPTCKKKISLGFETCLNAPKEQVTRIAQKKAGISQNLNRALANQKLEEKKDSFVERALAREAEL